MITCDIGRGINGELVSFVMRNHGESYVCAAVSFLVINTINCIEIFTDDDLECKYNPEGGLINFTMPSEISREARILLDTMLFGLRNVCEEHPDEAEIREFEIKERDVI